jgi:hypothetical protein
MFSLARTSTPSSAAKQALISSLPPPTTSSSPVMHSPVTHSTRVQSLSSSMHPDSRRLTGPLFGPPSPRIGAASPIITHSNGMTGYFQRQAFARTIHASPKETFTLTPTSRRNLARSPKLPLKSCLKSPQSSKSPILGGVKSPRFAPTMVSVRSREGPLWKEENTLEERLGQLSLGERDYKRRGRLDDVDKWKDCRERVPTPYGAAGAVEYFRSEHGVDH